MTNTVKHISRAFWESDSSGVVILSADWGATTLPPISLGPIDQNFGALERLSPEGSGRYCRYFRRKQSWVFTFQSKRYPQLLDRKVRVFLAADFNQWSEAIGEPEWELVPLNDEAGTTYEVSVPLKDIPAGDSFKFKFVTESGDWLDVPDSAANMVRCVDGISNFEFNPQQSGKHIYRFQTPEGYTPQGNERIIWRDASHEEAHELPHTQFLLSASTDLPLGAIIEDGRTIFRLFAPRATGVKLAYGQQTDASDAVLIDMSCVDGVTWEVAFDESLIGTYYTFRVLGESHEGTSHFAPDFVVLDPYAKACLGARGPAIVVDPARMQKVENQFTPPDWHDLVILEGHIRDLAAHAPIELTAEERRGYSGLRKWLKAKGSYLKEIGVNAIELQPIQEFDNLQPEDYHWGYMTTNFFSPESSYALEPEKASQIEEFRGLVQDFHDQNISVIVDVVYNHVGEPNHLLFVDKCYYFHMDEANDLMNWSGCGNDLRCDTPMARRLIIESLKHLIETYDVDGFRFDLAELIGIEVLREIEVELKKVKPSIILIAEPWSFRGHIQDELKETGFASWNDGFRESIAKYVEGKGNQDMIQYFLAGSPSSSRFAAQTINYTESHDDHCWMDRITERPESDGSDPTLLDRRRTHLMAAVLFASLGVPMLAAGQDFMRSKLGISNTYQRGDVNALDYNRRLVFSGTHSYFRNWIKFRLSELGRAFRYDGALQQGYLKFFVAEGSSATVAIFNADRSIDAPQLIFAVNPHLEYASIACDVDCFTGALQIADHDRFKTKGLESARIPTEGKTVHLPPLGCGLWLVQS
ncbi:MAG: pullulanase [Lentimonas sp.]|jgi:pullulanase